MLIHTYRFRVPFHDVDSMRVVWHGNYIRYFEQARCEMFALRGYNYDAQRLDGFLLPVISMETKFKLPCLFDEELSIEVDWDETNTNVLVLHYRVLGPDGKLRSRATVRHVAVTCDPATGEPHETLFELPARLLATLRG